MTMKFFRWNVKTNVEDLRVEVEEIVDDASTRLKFPGMEDTIQECRDELESAKEHVASAESAADEASGRASDAEEEARDARSNLDEIEEKLDSLHNILPDSSDERREFVNSVTSEVVSRFVVEEHDPVPVLNIDNLLDLVKGLKDSIWDLEAELKKLTDERRTESD